LSDIDSCILRKDIPFYYFGFFIGFSLLGGTTFLTAAAQLAD